jgi:diguanylate cyclase (GGDEF)-like protein/PAS domain S-box-containing protein
VGGARIGIECRLDAGGDLRWVRIKAQLAPQPDGRRRLVGTLQDITDRKHADQALRVAAAAFETNDGIVITDANRTIQQVNRAYLAMSGCEAHEMVGRNARILQSGHHDECFYGAMWQSIEATGSWAGEVWNRRRAGELYPAWVTITAVKGEDGQVTHYVATVVDITLRKAAEDEIARLAFMDALTHLPNRRMLMDRVQHALATRARSGDCGAVLYLDLDHFKQLNDLHGHDRGDQLLRQVATRLQASVRECDTVARIGGDEFVVLLESLDPDRRQAQAQALVVARKIQGRLSQVFQLDGLAYDVTPSIGLTVFDSTPTTVSELLKQADLAMYRAKAAARNTVRAYDPGWYPGTSVSDAAETRW